MDASGERKTNENSDANGENGRELSNEFVSATSNAPSTDHIPTESEPAVTTNGSYPTVMNNNQVVPRVSTENENSGAHLPASDERENISEPLPVMISTDDGKGTKEPESRQIKSPPVAKRTSIDHVNGTPKKRPRLEEDELNDIHDSLRSPVKEITVHHKDTHNDRIKRLRKAPDDLDEETMRIMLAHLKNNPPSSYFNDEEISAFMIRMNRVADRQTEYQHSMLGDSDSSDTSLFNEILAEEEDLAIGQAYFKEILTNIRKETEYELDSRTVGWIRRAAGLHRSKPDALLRESASDVALGADSSRAVKTRRSTRQKKIERRDKGIHLLAEALDDIEEQIGKFEKVEISIKRKRQEPVIEQPAQETSKKPKIASVPFVPRMLIAKICTKEVLPNGLSFEKHKLVRIKSIIVNGALLDASMSVNGLRGPAGLRPSVRGAPRQPLRPVSAKDLCLKRNFWRRRRLPFIMSTAFDSALETKESYTDAVSAAIPPAVKAAGIRFRLPRWETLNKTYLSALSPPRRRHSDDMYASFCMRLFRSLTGASRAWASREFFYSDIDREWFTRNEVLEEVARLGLGKDVKLTTQEWRLIRRRVRKRSRRFSRRFIASQLEELRKYRARVRLIQHNASNANAADIDYDIPAPIPFGTMVTAYSTKFKLILRGMVLSQEPKRFAYLVMFDRKEFGCEYCVDYNLATHGGPALLAPRTLSSRMTSLSIIGSVKGTVRDTCPSTQVDQRQELLKSMVFDPYPSPTNRATSIDGDDPKVEAIRQAAENEAMVGLLSLVDVATRRKELLTGALEEACAHFDANENVSPEFRSSCAWLKTNLLRTEQVMEAAILKLRLLYGRLYLAPLESNNNLTAEAHRHQIINKGFGEIVQPKQPAPNRDSGWTKQLVSEAAHVSKTMASVIIRRALSDKRAAPPPVEDLRFAEDLLGPVGTMLLTASYGHRFARTSKVGTPIPLTCAIESSSRQLVLSPDIPDVADADDLYIDVQASREAAAEDLQEAIMLLQTEVLLATAQKTLEGPN